MSSSGGGTPAVPTGPASGDLSGGYPAPVVSQVQGRPVSNAAPVGSQAFVWNGALWLPSAVVNSFNARTGAVALSQADVGAVAVASFAGRIGGIVPTTGDYTAAQVTNAADKAAAGAQTFTGAIQTPALGVNVAPGAAGTAKTANNTMDDGAGNATLAGNLTVTGGFLGAPTLTGVVALRPNGVGNNAGQLAVFADGHVITSTATGAVRNTLDDGAGNMLLTGYLKVSNAGQVIADGTSIYLRSTFGSNDGMVQITNAGAVSTFSGAGAQRNTLDDGSGNMSAAGSITAHGAVVPGLGGTAGGQVFSAVGAPAVGTGNNGDFYLRIDGGAGTTIYQKRAGAWVGIV